MIRSVIVALVLVAAAIPAVAQEREKVLDEKTLIAARDLGKTVIGWVRATVLPTAQAWKSQLDGAMSADDLSRLNALRARATELRQRTATIAGGIKTGWDREDYAAVKIGRAEMKKLAEHRAALMEELKPLAIKYKGVLQSIGEAAKPKIKEWAAEGREIGQRWWSEHKGELSPRAAKAIGNIMGRKGDLMQMLAPNMRRNVMAARFMLWDGSDFTAEIERALEQGDLSRFRRPGLR